MPVPPTPLSATGLLAQAQEKDLLRLITTGSVDDGKSTLIGRLLLDSRQVFRDHLDSLAKDSQRHGTVASQLDPALLLDGLEAEREQKITIDLAYRYFSTPRRKFILADAPGHVQYTRNMITGASTADLALLLVDARQGVLEQTRRHAFLCSLMGIQHMVVAVNKMDQVEFASGPFEEIRREFSDFAARLEVRDLHFLPLSALEGDNVVHPSERMPWFRGPTLLELLESVHIASDRNLIDLRFPVQSVSRPDSSFRGYQGTVASGVLRRGDTVMILPSKKRSKVERIVTFDGDLGEAHPPMAVTVTLADEVDVSRGDLLVRPENLPHQSRELEVMLAWLVETPLRTEARYLVQHGSRTTPAQVRQLRYRTNINSLRREPATTLELNEIGRCQLLTHRPLDFDAYFRNRTTGSLILIDPVSHETVAAGILVDRQVDSRPSEPTGSGAVTLEERCQRSGQRPALLWLDGPADLARAVGERLERELFQEGYLVRCFPGAESEGSVKVLLAEIRTLLSVGFLVLVGQGQPAQASGDLASILGVRVVLHPLKGVESDPGEEVEICRALLLGEAS